MSSRRRRNRGSSSSTEPSQDSSMLPMQIRGSNSGRHVMDQPLIDPLIGCYLAPVGWQNFSLAISTRDYTFLCSEFYHNLKLKMRNNNKFDPYIKSTVKGVKIRLELQTLSSIFNIPNEGDFVWFKQKELQKNINNLGISEQEFYTTFLTEIPNGEISKALLKDGLDLILTYIRSNIYPTTGHRDTISKYVGFILYCLVVRKQLNLPYIIIKTMHYITTIDNKHLPYTGALTTIFEHFGVELSEEPYKVVKSNISTTTLRLHETHPVRGRQPTQPTATNNEGRTTTCVDEDVYRPMPYGSPVYYATQDLNTNVFTNEFNVAGPSVSFTAPTEFQPNSNEGNPSVPNNFPTSFPSNSWQWF